MQGISLKVLSNAAQTVGSPASAMFKTARPFSAGSCPAQRSLPLFRGPRRRATTMAWQMAKVRADRDHSDHLFDRLGHKQSVRTESCSTVKSIGAQFDPFP
jgi:hypothetical protein